MPLLWYGVPLLLGKPLCNAPGKVGMLLLWPGEDWNGPGMVAPPPVMAWKVLRDGWRKFQNQCHPVGAENIIYLMNALNAQGKGPLSWSLVSSVCSRPYKKGDQWGKMGKIMTFSKIFAKVDSTHDFLYSLWLGHSTCRATGLMKKGTFPLHTATCHLHNDVFFSVWNLLSQENTSAKTSYFEK